MAIGGGPMLLQNGKMISTNSKAVKNSYLIPRHPTDRAWLQRTLLLSGGSGWPPTGAIDRDESGRIGWVDERSRMHRRHESRWRRLFHVLVAGKNYEFAFRQARARGCECAGGGAEKKIIFFACGEIFLQANSESKIFCRCLTHHR